MLLNDLLSEAVAARIAALDLSDIEAILSVTASGFRPAELHKAAISIARGEEVETNPELGRPRPLTIVAWSFVNDRVQYHDTYGLTDAAAGELQSLLRANCADGCEKIREVVQASLTRTGSTRPLVISTSGVPNAPVTPGEPPRPGKVGAELKEEIRRNAQLYGQYQFTAVDSGAMDKSRFRVPLGGGLFATNQSKAGAVDVARITRVRGRLHPLVIDRVAFIRTGRAPVFGAAIPDKVSFDGRLPPRAVPPADPIERSDSQTTR
uniref:Putative PAS-rich protein n=1 Tax=Erysiphe necator associated polymycovirus 1 TaxID=2742555 RepID=A0A8E3YWF5_9VIRU|nr:putative PAS-rich protein [Erysiphe necator associated polymycovirus 1]